MRTHGLPSARPLTDIAAVLANGPEADLPAAIFQVPVSTMIGCYRAAGQCLLHGISNRPKNNSRAQNRMAGQEWDFIFARIWPD